ncbi:LysM peptidoglycan-binding domain-containing protein [Megasphaera elsdenii]|uniref:LysM peptidoglycan-binding domain-containing protein n=1 Tax=Megasphaera elsdenii TaxID=907 RepID=UPI00242DD2AF|nr:LysM domain-containing protein [Megasphaera elsdenii]
MKTMKIYEHGQTEPRRKPKFQVVRAGLALVAAFGIGLYIGSTTPQVDAETIANDTAAVHVVEPGETVWDIARPVADAQGMDIREVIYLMEVNNNLDQNDTLTPGQKLIIRY